MLMPMLEKASPPLSASCHPLMLPQLFQPAVGISLKDPNPVDIQRVTYSPYTPPVSSISQLINPHKEPQNGILLGKPLPPDEPPS